MSSKTKSKKGIEPKLRFPEFRDAKAWEKQPLDKFLDYQQPTPYLVADTKYSNNYKTPVLTAGKTFLLGYTNEQHGIFNDGLPVIIFDDFTTATQFVDFPFKAKSSAMKILQAKNGASIKFMYEAMQMISYEIGTHERHWISKFAPMLIPIPVNPKEQKKIADCLSSLDELIETEDQKLNALQRHKKGLMQELFPAEGETLPNRRFPEFQNAPEWGKKTLKDLCNMQAGKFIQAADIYEEMKEGLYPCYGGNGLRGYVKSYTHRGKYPLIGRQGALCGNINLATDSFYATEHAVVVTAKSGVIVDWLYYQLVRLNLNQYATGQAQPGLSVDVLDKVVSLTPTDPKEQRRIADFLSSIDELITTQSQKLDALRGHKKGLMQQLFPAISDESNG